MYCNSGQQKQWVNLLLTRYGCEIVLTGTAVCVAEGSTGNKHATTTILPSKYGVYLFSFSFFFIFFFCLEKDMPPTSTVKNNIRKTFITVLLYGHIICYLPFPKNLSFHYSNWQYYILGILLHYSPLYFHCGPGLDWPDAYTTLNLICVD